MQAEEHLINIMGLKNFVRTHFAPDSPFRMLILSEPDYVPKQELIIKIPLYSRLLEQEKKRL